MSINKTKTIIIRATEEQHAAVKKAAEKRGLTISEYVRFLLINELEGRNKNAKRWFKSKKKPSRRGTT